jgi:hypothetical protein
MERKIMSAMKPDEDVVVFVDAPDAAYSAMRVSAGTPDSDIIDRVGNVAYLVVTFDQAKTLQQAANLARADGLAFVPPHIIAGLRRREPGISMKGIRTEFARRVEAYNAKPAEQPQTGFPFPAEDIFGDMKDIFGDLFKGPSGGPR